MPTTIEVYEFEELDDAVQDKLVDLEAESPYRWHWQDEYWLSAQEFAATTPYELVEADFTYGTYRLTDRRSHEHYTYEGERIDAISGLRAWKWLMNNGYFEWASRIVNDKDGSSWPTGFCTDYTFALTLHNYAWHGSDVTSTPTIRQVFEACFDAWMEEAMADLEYYYSEDCIREELTELGNKYTKDGIWVA